MKIDKLVDKSRASSIASPSTIEAAADALIAIADEAEAWKDRLTECGHHNLQAIPETGLMHRFPHSKGRHFDYEMCIERLAHGSPYGILAYRSNGVRLRQPVFLVDPTYMTVSKSLMREYERLSGGGIYDLNSGQETLPYYHRARHFSADKLLSVVWKDYDLSTTRHFPVDIERGIVGGSVQTLADFKAARRQRAEIEALAHREQKAARNTEDHAPKCQCAGIDSCFCRARTPRKAFAEVVRNGKNLLVCDQCELSADRRVRVLDADAAGDVVPGPAPTSKRRMGHAIEGPCTRCGRSGILRTSYGGDLICEDCHINVSSAPIPTTPAGPPTIDGTKDFPDLSNGIHWTANAVIPGGFEDETSDLEQRARALFFTDSRIVKVVEERREDWHRPLHELYAVIYSLHLEIMAECRWRSMMMNVLPSAVKEFRYGKLRDARDAMHRAKGEALEKSVAAGEPHPDAFERLPFQTSIGPFRFGTSIFGRGRGEP